MLLIRLLIHLIAFIFRWSQTPSGPTASMMNSNFNSIQNLHVNCPFCNHQMYAVANICNQCGRNRHTGQ